MRQCICIRACSTIRLACTLARRSISGVYTVTSMPHSVRAPDGLTTSTQWRAIGCSSLTQEFLATNPTDDEMERWSRAQEVLSTQPSEDGSLGVLVEQLPFLYELPPFIRNVRMLDGRAREFDLASGAEQRCD